MDNKTIFTKTAKGLGEAVGKTKALSRDLRNVLKEIDGKTPVEELAANLDNLSESKLQEYLTKLVNEDYIRAFASPAVAADDGLDFTFNAKRHDPLTALTMGAFLRELSPETGTARNAAVQRAQVDEMLRKEQPARAKEEADRKAREEADAKKRAEELVRKNAEEQARKAAEEKARLEAAVRAKKEAEEQARRKVAEEQARKAAEEKARLEAAARAKKEAEEQARRKVAEEQARKAAEEKARLEAAVRAKKEAEEQARRKAAAEQARKAAEEEIRHEAELRAQRAAEEKAKKETEERARREAEEQTRRQVEEKARQEAALQARKEAEARARLEVEQQAEQEEDEKARRKAVVMQIRREAIEKYKRDTEERTRKGTEENLDLDAGEQARLELEEQARKEADEKARLNAQRQARLAAEQEARREAEEEEKARIEAERVRREAEERARKQAEQRAAQQAEQQAEQQAKKRAEREREAKEAARLETEARIRKEAEERAQRHAEDKARRVAEALAKQEAPQSISPRTQRQTERKMEEAAPQQAKEAAKRLAAQEKKEQAERDAEQKAEQKGIREIERAAGAAKGDGRRHRAPVRWGRYVTLLPFLLIAAGLVLVQVMSFDDQARRFERAAEEKLQQPVKINKAYLALIPQPHWRLEGVSVGKDAQFKVSQIDAIAELDTLFSDKIAFKSIALTSPVVGEEGLGWLLFGTSRWRDLKIREISASNARLNAQKIALPPFNARVDIGADGTWRRATLNAMDGKTRIELQPNGERVQIELSAEALAEVFGSSFPLEKINVKGTASRNELTMTEFNGVLYDGAVSGNGKLKWDESWSLSGELTARQINTANLAPKLIEGGRLEASATYALQAQSANRLFSAPRLKGNANIRNGVLLGVDLASLLRGVSSGGKSSFTELDSGFVFDSGKLQLRNVHLAVGLVSARGGAELDALDNLNGRFAVDLNAAARQAHADLSLSGTLKEPRFKR